MTSIASTSAHSHPLSSLAAQQAERAKFLRTGIDEDAAIGDPDKDGARKTARTTVSGPASSKAASAVPTVNAAPAIQGTSAGSAATAYSRPAAP